MTGDGTHGVERVGLLFVHGIGEQGRFEHLTGSVAELAELFDRADAAMRVSVVDRTPGWTLPPGEPHPDGLAPMTLSVRSPAVRIDFDCHEVWWADLGGRSGITDVIGFWLWGLGQWAAPIYREVDASRLSKDDTQSSTKLTASLAKLPNGVAGTAREPAARRRLMLAAVAAALTAVTWSLAKRIAGALLGQAPSPTLIVRYIGDVRTYTEPGGPGRGTATDPGQPRRVGIRRRMVQEMLAMAAKPLDRWHVLAHSLGTVVAYNGLTEIGHTLPNYLGQAQWQALPEALKSDVGCQRRDDIQNMMPSRPPWLADDAVINRPLLFARLGGLFTYGSPLGKFAALWPRIVATATDRADPNEPTFPPGCRWINFAAPHDPVAGMLDAFDTRPGAFLHNAIPTVENVATPLGRDFGVAHIRYLKGEERFADGIAVAQKCQLAAWLLGEQPCFDQATPSARDRRRVGLGYAGLVVVLWLAAALVLTGLRAAGWAIGEGGAAEGWHAAGRFLAAFGQVIAPLLGTVLAVITFGGLWRWYRESRYNLRLAKADARADPARKGYWDEIVPMLTRHRRRASRFLCLCVPLLALALAYDWVQAIAGEGVAGRLTVAQIIVALLLMAAAAQAQKTINQMVKPARPMHKPTALPVQPADKPGSDC